MAVDDEEHAEGLRCVGAPVLTETGVAAAAISISGPRSRISDERLEQLRETVARIVGEVTREYGGRPAGG